MQTLKHELYVNYELGLVTDDDLITDSRKFRSLAAKHPGPAARKSAKITLFFAAALIVFREFVPCKMVP